MSDKEKEDGAMKFQIFFFFDFCWGRQLASQAYIREKMVSRDSIQLSLAANAARNALRRSSLCFSDTFCFRGLRFSQR